MECRIKRNQKGVVTYLIVLNCDSKLNLTVYESGGKPKKRRKEFESILIDGFFHTSHIQIGSKRISCRCDFGKIVERFSSIPVFIVQQDKKN